MIRPSSPLTMLLSRHTRRREFITLLGGAAAMWPLAARAQQQPERMRRIGVLMLAGESAQQAQARLGAFVQRLTELGWTDGHNAHLDVRWGAGAAANYRR